MAANIDLFAEQGATFRQTFTFTNSDGSAVNFTGCTGKMQVRAAYGASTAIEELNTTNGGLTLGSGTINLLLSATTTALINVPPSGSVPPTVVYQYDLFVTFPSGDTNRLLYGKFTVVASITK